VALGLAGLGSVPVSACAAMHSQASECATPQTKTECEHMGMEHAKKPPVSFSHSGKTCCGVSDAPAPEAQTWAGSFAVAALAASTSSAVVETQPAERAWSPQIAKDSSPPRLQSLFCTFLI
jgi:anti-sigma factor RsiW